MEMQARNQTNQREAHRASDEGRRDMRNSISTIKYQAAAVVIIVIAITLAILAGTTNPMKGEAYKWKHRSTILVVPAPLDLTSPENQAALAILDPPPPTPTITVTASPVVTSPAPAPSPPTTAPSGGVPSDTYAAWTQVAVCEESGWTSSSGSAYPNSLGIMAEAWYGHGGGSDVSPEAQIAVAQSLINSLVGSYIQGVQVYSGFVPDQNGCSAW